jgi:hypothetical protein
VRLEEGGEIDLAGLDLVDFARQRDIAPGRQQDLEHLDRVVAGVEHGDSERASGVGHGFSCGDVCKVRARRGAPVLTRSPWFRFMSGVANRITLELSRRLGAGAARHPVRRGTAARRARSLHSPVVEGTMAGKSRKGGSSGNQQTGQGNKQGGANQGKSATSGKGSK